MSEPADAAALRKAGFVDEELLMLRSTADREELEQLVIDARFECTGPNARLTTTEYAATLNKMLGLIRSIDEVNES